LEECAGIGMFAKALFVDGGAVKNNRPLFSSIERPTVALSTLRITPTTCRLFPTLSE
jgi:hypothetical protein